MSRPISIQKVVHTSLISAFTIATALIWKDVIMNIIIAFAPAQNTLLYQILVALIATVFLIVALFIILKTESETQFVMKKLKDGTVKFTKANPSPPQPRNA